MSVCRITPYEIEQLKSLYHGEPELEEINSLEQEYNHLEYLFNAEIETSKVDEVIGRMVKVEERLNQLKN